MAHKAFPRAAWEQWQWPAVHLVREREALCCTRIVMQELWRRNCINSYDSLLSVDWPCTGFMISMSLMRFFRLFKNCQYIQKSSECFLMGFFAESVFLKLNVQYVLPDVSAAER